ncbi:MAG: mechanosensitive ion channel domain-containing protein [Candidatus Helarchaeota archaeon]
MTEEEKRKKIRRMGIVKTIIYITILIVSLLAVTFLFGYSDIGSIPPLLLPISGFILLIAPYLIWIQAAIVLIIGFLFVKTLGNTVYAYSKEEYGVSNAATLRTLIRLVGFAIVITVVVSIIGVDPTAAIAISSFLGIAIGFAGQAVIGNFLAGIVLLITRPFKPGETITVKDITGVVKDISLTRTRIELPDGKNVILIPSSVLLSSNIKRPKRKEEYD